MDSMESNTSFEIRLNPKELLEDTIHRIDTLEEEADSASGDIRLGKLRQRTTLIVGLPINMEESIKRGDEFAFSVQLHSVGEEENCPHALQRIVNHLYSPNSED